MLRFFARSAPVGTLLLLACSLAPDSARASGSASPLDHAPIGVMGDHLHHRGEWMLSYRFMAMHMEGNRDGTDRVPLSAIKDPGAPFLVAPTEMDMQMHMLGLMVAPSDRVTFMLMLPYLELEMGHVNRVGVIFTTRSEGIGDLRVAALVRGFESQRHSVHLNLGLGIPTGSIHEADPTPLSGGAAVRLPFPMQTGSGTFDLLPGITWNARPLAKWSLGAQLMGTLRLGRNDIGYRLGHRALLTAWSGIELLPWLSVSARLGYEHWGDVRGEDRLQRATSPPAPAPFAGSFIVPTADPDLRAGSRLDGLIGLNLLAGDWLPALKGHRLAIEASLPLHQDLDGPQLETDWSVVVGWQKAF